MAGRNYTDLIAWQRAMDLVEAVYATTREFPKEEQYGLTSQIRKAAVSIPSNIAEGQGRRSRKEFHHHLAIAHGSLRELETQVLIAKRLKYLSEQSFQDLKRMMSEVGRLVTALSNSLLEGAR